MKALLTNLTAGERDLIRETEKERMAELDEDALVELHRRIRRARNKYVGLYRREAAGRVRDVGGRGAARPKNRRNAGRAEIFEDALARVSRRLALVAKQSAADLKAERLAAARADAEEARAAKAAGRAAVAGTGTGGPAGAVTGSGRTPAATRPPARRKRDASSLAAGARRQARRDTR